MIRLLSRTLVPVILAASLLSASAASHRPLTAFQALAVAAKVVTPEAHHQLIEIEGPRSDTEQCPDVWKFVFWDSTAHQNGRLVTVTRGVVTEIRDGFFELDKMRILAYKQNEAIPPQALRVDSDKALVAVIRSSTLQGVRLSSVTFALTKNPEVGQAVWKIELLADNAGRETDIGYARVSAETAGIIEMKIDLELLKKKQ